MTTTAIELAIPPQEMVVEKLQVIRDFQMACKTHLVEGLDYGTIPNTGDRPTLFKPGAEKMIRLLDLADEYEIDKIEDWDRPLFAYNVRCRLRHIASGQHVAEGVGQANSMESKWRYHWAWPSDVPEDQRAGLQTRQINTRNGQTTKYRVVNDDIFSLVNTILKMAKKRALVDAALSVGRLSGIFTQDLDEIRPAANDAPEPAPARTPATATAGSSPTTTIGRPSPTNRPCRGRRPCRE